MGFMFNKAKTTIGPNEWATAPIGLLLIGGGLGYVPSPDVDTLAGLPIASVELDVIGYARAEVNGRNVVQNDVSDRSEWNADDVVFASLGEVGDEVAGAIIFVQIFDDSDSMPIFWLDNATGDLAGTDFTVAFAGGTVCRFRAPA